MTLSKDPSPQNQEGWLDQILFNLYPCKAPAKCAWALNDKCMCGKGKLRADAKASIQKHIDEAVAGAEQKAMLREAVHRANDASDRLLRIDREACIAWHGTCLQQLTAKQGDKS